MTESAPVLRREVDLSSDSQLKTLNQTKSLTDSELADYRTRSETSRSRFKIPNLSRQPLPGESDSRANLAERHPFSEALGTKGRTAERVAA